MSGTGFVGETGQIAQSPGYRFALIIELPGCELIGQPADAMVSVGGSGALAGSFVVPTTGDCFQQVNGTRSLPPGLYRVVLGSHSGDLGTFSVTSRA